MVQNNSARDCLSPPLFETLPMRCQQLKQGYTECRRGLLDMRKRFRGNQPIALSKELEGAGGGGQLYAGRSAVTEPVGKTDGNEDSKTS